MLIYCLSQEAFDIDNMGGGSAARLRGFEPPSFGSTVPAKVNAFRFHDLRHTFGTRFIEAGGNVVLLSKIMGHSTISLT